MNEEREARIKKDDTVIVIKGKDNGKTGKVIRVFPKKKRALIQGINLIKKHQRQRSQEEKGGIITKEASVSLANIMPFCKSCNKAVRLGAEILKDGTKNRYCRKCNEVF